jgi:hypothetical protein
MFLEKNIVLCHCIIANLEPITNSKIQVLIILPQKYFWITILLEDGLLANKMVNSVNNYLSLCSHSGKINNTYLNTHTFLTLAKNIYSNVVNPLHGLA